MTKEYDFIVIWAGFYWMHTARFLWNKWLKVCLIEEQWDAFRKASYINQARVHNWYHYPRSYETAEKSKDYFRRFCNDFGFSINRDYKKIYSIASQWSKTTPADFESFCKKLWIPCNEVDSSRFFKNGIARSYETLEYSFDAVKIRDFMKSELERRSNVDCYYYNKIDSVEIKPHACILKSSTTGNTFCAKKVVNATYAKINEINELFWVENVTVKHELAEVAICNVSEKLHWFGVTVMDGDYFSLMPFGIWNKYSLTSVKYTPHEESFLPIAKFHSIHKDYWRPATNFPKMLEEAKLYLRDDIQITHHESLFTTKTVLANTELDDARPTFLKRYDLWNENELISIFSWKINTIYEIEEFLQDI